jgi:succinate dehydrogenase / fumarate reductase cytochrome b subunit
MSNERPARPLSPHLSIYSWQITNTLSILHRLTGVVLSVGVIFLTAWLWAAAYNGEYFHAWQSFFAGPIGLIMLFGWSAAFYYHLGNGIRHLFWDAGKGFALPNVTKSGLFNVAFAAIATAVTWVVVFTSILGGSA